MEDKTQLEQPNFTRNSLTQNSQGKQGLQEENAKENKNSLEDFLNKGAEFSEKEKNENGSNNNLGKFKNSESLLNSYNNLQSDYTKKCQALKELQKQIEEEKAFLQAETNFAEEFENLSNQFFEANPKAKKYEKALTNLILKDKDLKQSKTPFESAWLKFLQDNYLSPDEIITNENFLNNYIFNNEKIKSQIITDYFSNLKINSSPILISNQKGSKTIVSPSTKPKTIGEAGKLAEELFL